MNLHDLYQSEGRKSLNLLAEKIQCNPHYLYHCAIGIKTPSPELVLKLVEAEPRLTKEQIRPDIWKDPPKDNIFLVVLVKDTNN